MKETKLKWQSNGFNELVNAVTDTLSHIHFSTRVWNEYKIDVESLTNYFKAW